MSTEFVHHTRDKTLSKIVNLTLSHDEGPDNSDRNVERIMISITHHFILYDHSQQCG